MHEVLVNRLGGLGLPRKSVVRLTDRPDMTLDVYRGRKTTMQQCNIENYLDDLAGADSADKALSAESAHAKSYIYIYIYIYIYT